MALPNDLKHYSSAAKAEYLAAHEYHTLRGAQGSASDMRAREAAELVEEGQDRAHESMAERAARKAAAKPKAAPKPTPKAAEKKGK